MNKINQDISSNSSGCVHPINPFALPLTFNFMDFTVAAPEPMVAASEPTALPPPSVSHELYVPPGDDFTVSAPEPMVAVPEPTASPPSSVSHELYVSLNVYDFTPSAEFYNLTVDFHHNIRPGRNKLPPATRNKEKTTGESPTPTTHAPHSTASEVVLDARALKSFQAQSHSARRKNQNFQTPVIDATGN